MVCLLLVTLRDDAPSHIVDKNCPAEFKHGKISVVD